jgi:hypothetical protein
MIGRYYNFDRTLLQLASQAIATMHLTHPVSSTGESSQFEKCLVMGYNGSIFLGATNPSIGCPWADC